MTTTELAQTFAPHRPRLLRLAYRMVGSVAEAEDIVQDAYLRWHNVDAASGPIDNAGAYLARIVTRLCLDHLKSARVQRESYLGTWLPEPFVAPANDLHEQADDLTMTLMIALERLSPLERAAFLLHDVFGMEFTEVGITLDRDAGACRQLATRARTRVQEAKPRFPVTEAQGRDIANAFFAASRRGDMAGLQKLLADDVVFYADGGGKKPAAVIPVVGLERVLRLFTGFLRFEGYAAPQVLREGAIDGLPGFVTIEHDQTLQTMAFAIEGGKITTIYVMRNPDKLRHLTTPAAKRPE